MVASLPLVLFPFCLIAAALSDARRFIIPNELCAALVVGFGIAALLVGMDLATLGNHVLTAIVVLAVGFGLFCINVFGAGDGKLLAAIALWFGWPDFLPCIIVITLFGGGLSLGICYARAMTRRFPSISARSKPLATLAATETLKCPYGIAICLGTLLTFRNTPIFEALIAQVL